MGPFRSEPMQAADASLPQRLRDSMARVAASVAVLTVTHEGAVHGTTISSFLSVSLEPPIVLVSLHRDSSVIGPMEAGGRFGVTILAQEHEPIARALARRDRQPLAESMLVARAGVPLLREGCARFSLTLRQRLRVGDHDVVLANVIWTESDECRPLVYQMRAYRRLDAQ